MYAFISGKLAESSTDYVVIENQGIGYQIAVPGGDYFPIPEVGADIRLYTHFIANENGVNLYGFNTKEERDIFLRILSVSGIGPKGSVAVLATLGLKGVISAILSDDEKAIAKAPGVGAKTAKRIILDLKDKIDIEETAFGDVSIPAAIVESDPVNDAIMALTALGYPQLQAKNAVMSVENAGSLDVETLLSLALKEM